jgi:hypothetical protein
MSNPRCSEAEPGGGCPLSLSLGEATQKHRLEENLSPKTRSWSIVVRNFYFRVVVEGMGLSADSRFGQLFFLIFNHGICGIRGNFDAK